MRLASFKQTRRQVTQPKICSAKPLGDHSYNNSLKPIKKFQVWVIVVGNQNESPFDIIIFNTW